MYVAFRLKFNDSHLLASWRALSASILKSLKPHLNTFFPPSRKALLRKIL